MSLQEVVARPGAFRKTLRALHVFPGEEIFLRPLDVVTGLWLDTGMTTKRIPTANNLYVRLVGNAARGYIASVERRNGTQVAATDTFPFAAGATTAGHELAAAQ